MSVMQVAKLAQVPYSTAWRVMNRKSNVAPDVARRVMEVARQIGYDPSQQRRGRKARSAAGIRTKNVALLHLRSSTTLSLSTLRMVEQVLAQHNLNLIVGHVAEAQDLPQAVRSGNVDGILGYGQFPASAISPSILEIPAVWMMTRSDFEPDPWGDRVQPDHKAIGRLAAHYLLDRGHEHIAFIGAGPHLAAPATADRWGAFHAVATATGQARSVQFIDTPIAPHGEPCFGQDLEAVVDRWMQLRPRPTGLFISTDRITALLQRILQQRGISIGPGADVELVSCDNEPEILSSLDPSPASIDLNRTEISRQAVERLLWRVRNGNASPQITTAVQPTLPAGASAAPCPPAL